jgi:hypothetical protein
MTLRASSALCLCLVVLSVSCAINSENRVTANHQTPRSNAKSSAYYEYDQSIIKQVQAHWEPLIAQNENLKRHLGIVCAHFELRDDGTVQNLHLTRESTDADANAACLRAIENSSRFPPLPEALRKLPGDAPRDVDLTFQY